MVASALVVLQAPPVSGAACPGILAGSCWSLDEATVKGVASAPAAGGSVRCSLRCRVAGGGVLVLREDGTYSSPATAATVGCESGEVAIPDEHGIVRARRRKLLLVPTNLGEFGAALDACAARNVTIRHYRTTIRIADDGNSLTGVTKLRLQTPGRVPVATTVTERFTATRVQTARPAADAPRSPRARELPPCSIDLEPRCVTY